MDSEQSIIQKSDLKYLPDEIQEEILPEVDIDELKEPANENIEFV